MAKVEQTNVTGQATVERVVALEAGMAKAEQTNVTGQATLERVGGVERAGAANGARIEALAARLDAAEAWINATKAGPQLPPFPPSCSEMGLPAGGDGVYTVYPDGQSGQAVSAYCMTIPKSGFTTPVWTLIASQPEPVPLTVNFRSAYGSTPTPSQTGALAYYWKKDLTKFGQQLYVDNSQGERTIFQLGEFTNPIVLDSPNFVTTPTSSAEIGIIAGNAFPVLCHYQTTGCDASTHGDADGCGTPGCIQTLTASTAYSYGRRRPRPARHRPLTPARRRSSRRLRLGYAHEWESLVPQGRLRWHEPPLYRLGAAGRLSRPALRGNLIDPHEPREPQGGTAARQSARGGGGGAKAGAERRHGAAGRAEGRGGGSGWRACRPLAAPGDRDARL